MPSINDFLQKVKKSISFLGKLLTGVSATTFPVDDYAVSINPYHRLNHPLSNLILGVAFEGTDEMFEV
jgi:hypothetical protein